MNAWMRTDADIDIAAPGDERFRKGIAAKRTETNWPIMCDQLLLSDADCSPLQCPPVGLVLLRCISRAKSALEV
jgi:hypothetical protein